jgi:hypothetical protein
VQKMSLTPRASSIAGMHESLHLLLLLTVV